MNPLSSGTDFQMFLDFLDFLWFVEVGISSSSDKVGLKKENVVRCYSCDRLNRTTVRMNGKTRKQKTKAHIAVNDGYLYWELRRGCWIVK